MNSRESVRAFACSWLILACVSTMGAQTTAQMRIVGQGARSTIQSRREVVIRTEAEWAALGEDHRGGQPAAPAVDFSREMVVGVFLGSKPTAGWGVTIVGAKEEGGVLHVRYRETAPPPGTMAAQVITFPYALAAIPKSSAKDVAFEKVP